jgi:ribonuclease HII
MSKSINEIRLALNNVNSLDDELLRRYSDDARKGVRRLIDRKIKQLHQQKDKIQAFQKRLKYEHQFWNNNVNLVAGVDEVGRGPLAGPVVAAAVILPHDFSVYEVNDSKKLSPKKRLSLSEQIKNQAIAYSFGIASNKLIDKINIYEATRIAMKDAILGLKYQPNHIIVDAMDIDVPLPQLKLIKGDSKSASVSAASIIAKVYRDTLMDEYALQYPEYDFDHNAGYGTKKHLLALKEYGATPIHRISFKPVSDMLFY